MTLVKWNPARELLSLEKEFSKMFSEMESKFGFNSGKQDTEAYENAVWCPLTDITENKDNYELNLDLPGVEKENVKISYTDGQLSISGERRQDKEEKDAQYHRVERTYGKFYRSFALPKLVVAEKINAEFKNGSLNITIPKAEEAKPKELEIKVK
ncbi:MAG: Hsp20/alpha crystallin family protein [Ignavibacteria bacterium]|nr:Hsp20/alpha crystallin family protein [Ignavibacteria bacterium]